MGGARDEEHRVSTSSTESMEWARFGGAQVSDLAPSVQCEVSEPQGIMDWRFDTLRLDQQTNGSSLVWVTSTVLHSHANLVDSHIATEFREIYTRAQSQYNATAVSRENKIPAYHNHTHAADVCQAMHFLCHKSALFSRIPFSSPFYGKSDIVLYATVFASAMHDFDHLGVTNDFLVYNSDPLAIRYNDKSVLENHHAASAFELIHASILSLSNENMKMFRFLVIEMILSTDMHHHYDLMSVGVPNPDRDYLHCLKIALHCADVSSGTRPLEVCRKWTSLIMEEFFLEGGRSLAINPAHPLPPMMDRNAANMAKIQSSFYDVIVRPLFVYFEILCPEIATTCITNLDNNRLWWLVNGDAFTDHQIDEFSSDVV